MNIEQIEAVSGEVYPKTKQTIEWMLRDSNNFRDFDAIDTIFEDLVCIAGLYHKWKPLRNKVELFSAGGSVINLLSHSTPTASGSDIDVFFRTSYVHMLELSQLLSEIKVKLAEIASMATPFGELSDEYSIKVQMTTSFDEVDKWTSFTHKTVDGRVHKALMVCPNSFFVVFPNSPFRDKTSKVEYNFITNPSYICPDTTPLHMYLTRFDFTVCAAAYCPSKRGSLDCFQFHPATPEAILSKTLNSFCEPHEVQAYRLMKYLRKGYTLDSGDLEWYEAMMGLFSDVISDKEKLELLEQEEEYETDPMERRSIREKWKDLHAEYSELEHY